MYYIFQHFSVDGTSITSVERILCLSASDIDQSNRVALAAGSPSVVKQWTIRFVLTGGVYVFCCK